MSAEIACTSRNWSVSASGTIPPDQLAPPSSVRSHVPP